MLADGLNAIGTTIMVISCGFVLFLLAFCYLKVFRTPHVEEDMHGPLDIDTHDTNT